MLSVKLLDDYIIKSQDIKTFKIQLLRDGKPHAIPTDCTVTLLIANSKSIVKEEEMVIVDAEQGIVQFTLKATIGTGSFDCEFVLSNGNDINLTFPDNGFTVLKISECLAERPVQEIIPTEYEALNERMDGFIMELDVFEGNVENTLVDYETTFANMQATNETFKNEVTANVGTYDGRLEAIEGSVKTVTGLDQPVNTIENANNLVEVVNVQGNTYQNIVQNEYLSHFQMSTGTLENGYATIDSYKIDPSTGQESTTGNILVFVDSTLLKPNTTYTVFFKELLHESKRIIVRDTVNQINLSSNQITLNNKLIFATTEAPTNKLVIYYYNMKIGEKAKIGGNIQILEGDWTGVDYVPFVDGIQSVDTIEVKSIGKNLWHGNLKDGYLTKDFIFVEDGIYKHFTTFLTKGTYTLYFLNENSSIGYFFTDSLRQSNFDRTALQLKDIGKYKYNFTINKDENIYISFKIGNNTVWDNSDVMLNVGTTSLDYEPYQETALQIPLAEPLRKLPNGVADTIEGNKIVRRIGKIILDGSENWGTGKGTLLENRVNTLMYQTDTYDDLLIDKNNQSAICDQYAINDIYRKDEKGFEIYGTVTYSLRFGDTIMTVDEWKEKLKTNPVTIYYQTKEPIEEEISYNEILETYPDGHILINGTVLPTVNVEYATGLVGRVEKVETEVAELHQEMDDISDHFASMEDSVSTVTTLTNTVNKIETVSGIGKVTNVQGKTMQNLISNTEFKGIQVGTYEMENGYAKITSINEGYTSCPILVIMKDCKIKPNTTYTIFIKERENYQFVVRDELNIKNLKDGASINPNNTIVFTTLETVPTELTLYYNGLLVGQKVKVEDNVVLLEGDYSQIENIPYFEGIQSVQTPIELHSTGKNLLKMNHRNIKDFGKNENTALRTFSGDGIYLGVTSNNYYTPSNTNDLVFDGNKIEFTYSGSGYGVGFDTKVLPNTTYKISCKNNNNCKYYFSVGQYNKEGKNVEFGTTNDGVFVTTQETEWVNIVVTGGVAGIFISIENIQLEIGNIATTYQEYQQPYELQIPFTEPLRSLPNGVHDEIDLQKGIITRNVGKYVVDSTQIILNTNYTTDTKLVALIDGVLTDANSLPTEFETICNNFGYCETNETTEFMKFRYTSNRYLFFHFDITKVPTIESAKTWFENNPTFVLYQLATPVIEQIEITDNELKIYNEGNIFINNAPIIPSAIDIQHAVSLTNRIEQLENTAIENRTIGNQAHARVDEIVTSVTGLETFTEPVSDLTNVGNITLENLKGNTIQNLCPAYTDDFVGYMTTGACIFEDGYVTLNAGVSTTEVPLVSMKAIDLLKPNTTYTYVLDIKNNTLDGMFFLTTMNVASQFYVNTIYPKGTLGRQIGTLTTVDDLSDKTRSLRSSVQDLNSTGSITFRVMLFEGELVDNEIPTHYFTGIQSTGDAEGKIAVKTTGKNLFDITQMEIGAYNEKYYYVQNGKLYTNILDERNNRFEYILHLDAGTYTLSTTNPVLGRIYKNSFGNLYNGAEGVHSGTLATTHTFILEKPMYVAIKFANNTSSLTYPYEIGYVQLEKSAVATAYEPYQESVAEFEIEPLRKLPNGVCDEIAGNKIIRRVKKIVLDGTESWSTHQSTDTYISSYLTTSTGKFIDVDFYAFYKNAMCDKFKIETWDDEVKNEKILWNNGSSSIGIFLPISELVSEDVNGVKTWLTTNNLTIYAPLKTPIIEEIPTTLLATYENGHFIFDNEITPTQAVIKHVDSLIARIEQLEETQQADNETLRNLCAVVDVLCLQIGELIGE